MTAGVWTQDFSPKDVDDFTTYLAEKIRTLLRKKSRKEKKDALADDYNILNDMLAEK